MCFKLGNDELETVRGLMTMTVISVISDALKIDLDEIHPGSHLIKDLGMTPKSQARLGKLIMEMFDELVIDFSTVNSVQDLVDQTLQDELAELEYEESAY